jgi:hypothetical protein
VDIDGRLKLYFGPEKCRIFPVTSNCFPRKNRRTVHLGILSPTTIDFRSYPAETSLYCLHIHIFSVPSRGRSPDRRYGEVAKSSDDEKKHTVDYFQNSPAFIYLVQRHDMCQMKY